MQKKRSNHIRLYWISGTMLRNGMMGMAAAMLSLLLIGSMFDLKIWKPEHEPLGSRKIVIDAGHGGPDGGAESPEGTMEKDIALAVVLKIRELCEQAGAEVFVTRETDTDLAGQNVKKGTRKRTDLKQRVELIQQSGADLLISIHLNSIPDRKWRGAQSFYDLMQVENRTLAERIQEELKAGLENTSRDAKPISNIYLLRKSTIPSALIEIGFLSNPEERDLLKSEKYQRKIAESVYRGIIRYIEQQRIS